MKIQALARLQSTQNVLAMNADEAGKALVALQQIFGKKYKKSQVENYQSILWKNNLYKVALFLDTDLKELGVQFICRGTRIEAYGKTKDALFRAIRKQLRKNAKNIQNLPEDVQSVIEELNDVR